MNALNMPGANPAVATSVDAASHFQLTLTRAVTVVIALLATALSLGIAAYAGSLRGGTTVQRAMIVALAEVAVLYVHLAPMYWCVFTAPIRTAGSVLWFIGVAVVMYGQATFFLQSQRDAGNQRAASVQVVEAAHSINEQHGRSVAEIAQDRVHVVADLARVESLRCIGYCPTVAVREARLNAELAALDAEATDVKRREATEDRLVANADRNEALRESLRADPVASEIASWVGTTEVRFELALAAVLAVVLEGAAILGWLLVVRAWPRSESRETVALSRAFITATTIVPGALASPEVDAFGAESPVDVPVKSEDDEVLDKLHVEVLADRLKPTQAAIREYLGCGQATAGRYARLYRSRFSGVSE